MRFDLEGNNENGLEDFAVFFHKIKLYFFEFMQLQGRHDLRKDLPKMCELTK